MENGERGMDFGGTTPAAGMSKCINPQGVTSNAQTHQIAADDRENGVPALR